MFSIKSLGGGGGVVRIRRLRVVVSGRNKRHLNQSCHMILAQESSQLHSMGLFLSVVAVCWRKTHGVDNNGNTLFRVQSFSVKDLGGSGFVHFCSRGDWFNYSVLFYQTNVLIKFSVAMRRSLFSVLFFFFFVLILLYHANNTNLNQICIYSPLVILQKQSLPISYSLKIPNHSRGMTFKTHSNKL